MSEFSQGGVGEAALQPRPRMATWAVVATTPASELDECLVGTWRTTDDESAITFDGDTYTEEDGRGFRELASRAS